MSVIEFVATGALISTLGLYLTEVPLLHALLKEQKTDSVQFSAILMNLINNILALYYAFLTNSDVLKTTNSFGICIHLLICGASITVNPKRRGPILQLIGAAVFIWSCHYYSATFVTENARIDTLGIISSTVCSLAYVTPVLAVIEAQNSGAVELISLPISCGSLLCSSSWLLYGVLLNDIYIQLPNIPGIIVSLAALYVVFQIEQKPKGKKIVVDFDNNEEKID